MSAVLTKKPGGDYATQLTFPAVFAAQAKANNLASQFYPDVQSRPMVLPRGSGLQEDYHEQKRLDANRRCLNGVRDNASSMARYLGSHANYIVPKPVLSQRKYANPSNGNQADIYSSRPIQWNQSMRGGVMRTEEGQKWVLGKLKERVPQLDAIKAAKEAFLMGVPVGAVGAEAVGISDITTKVELYGLLSRVEADVEQGVVNNKTVEKSQSLLKLMFGFTPYAETREVEEIMESVEYIKKSLDSIAEQGEEGVAQQSKAGEAIMRNASFLSGLYDKMRQYLVRMNGVLNRPRKEREKASSVFIKSLGFSELEKKEVSARVRREIAVAEAANPNADPDGEDAEAASVVDDDGDDDDDDEDEDDDEAGAPRGGPTYAVSSSLSSFGPSASSSSSAFGPPTPPRSPRSGKDAVGPGDSEFDRLAFAEAEGYEDRPFDVDEREKFGKRSGAFFGEAPPEEPVVRSTGSESAEMMVLPEETEESIARRSGLLSAEAAVSEPAEAAVRRPPSGPYVYRNLLSESEQKNLAIYKNAVARVPEWFNENSLENENLDATAARARQEAPRPYKGNPNSRSELRRAMKNRYTDPFFFNEVRRLEAKNKQLNEAAKAAQKKKPVAGV